MDVRVLTWNVFHCRAGHPDVGPTWRSTLLGQAEWDARHVHVNRKLTELVAAIVAGDQPDLAMLQEVPPADLGALADATGMEVATVRMGPRVGPAPLRARLARTNPDLWRSHEGSANAILVGGRLRLADERPQRLRLNPPAVVAAALRSGVVTAREAADWAWEPRAAVLTRVLGGTRPLWACCVHLHHRPAAAAAEAERLAAWLARLDDEALIVAGDFNVRPGDPAFAPLHAIGLTDAQSGPGIDRVLVRGGVVREGRRWDPAERERLVRWRGAERRVRVSDHDPVSATVAL